jgi:cell division protein FtsB
MSSTGNNKGKLVKRILLNKYLIVFVVFAVFVTFFDNHNLIKRWKTAQKINQLEQELKYYQDEIKATKRKKNELQSSNENLEKFAREQYLMKKQNEDIFIIKE